MLIFVTKDTGWKWWMRFKSPIEYVQDSGCLSDDCSDVNIDTDGCSCNNFFEARKSLLSRGYKHVGTNMNRGLFIWSNGINLIYNYHRFGR